METDEEYKSKVESSKTKPSSFSRTTKECKKPSMLGHKQAIKIAVKKSIKKNPKYDPRIVTRKQI